MKKKIFIQQGQQRSSSPHINPFLLLVGKALTSSFAHNLLLYPTIFLICLNMLKISNNLQTLFCFSFTLYIYKELLLKSFSKTTKLIITKRSGKILRIDFDL